MTEGSAGGTWHSYASLWDRFAQRSWRTTRPPAQHELTRFVFLRLFGVILCAAFWSLDVQILGLIGHAGLLPLEPYLEAAHQGWGASAYWRLPTLFWLDASDAAIGSACLIGLTCGALVALDILVRPALVLACALYLSLVYAGQVFTNYQWDQLLVETSFLAIFLTAGSPLIIFLFRLLLFRFLFLAGITKWLSGDRSWRDLTALDTHPFTQPLPAPLAWHASQLPQGLLHVATAATLALEIIFAFMIFLPRLPRMLFAWSVIIFQVTIIATGNYNFFNLLTILLCIFLFDDRALQWMLPARLTNYIGSRAAKAGRLAQTIAIALTLLLIPMNLDRIYEVFADKNLPVVGELTRGLAPLLIVNHYGLFITTTVTRPEIVIQGSDDGQTWRDYAFTYYPGPLAQAPGWNIPHQPRLDWQMWFAAYDSAAQNPWFISLLQALLEGRPQVLDLMGDNPFADHPPQMVRALLYDYRFADAELHAKTGQWWDRRLEGMYFPQVSLADLARLRAPPHAGP